MLNCFPPGVRVIYSDCTTPSRDLLDCLACPKQNGVYQQIERRNVATHQKSKKHQSNEVDYIRELQQANSSPAPARSTNYSNDNTPPTHITPPFSSSGSDLIGTQDEELVKLSDLWTSTTREISVDEDLIGESSVGTDPTSTDYFQEYIQALQTGQIYKFHLPRQAAGSSELPDENEGNMGEEIDDVLEESESGQGHIGITYESTEIFPFRLCYPRAKSFRSSKP